MGQCDTVYRECNMCVARMALNRGWTAGIGQHEGDDWGSDWRNIVFIDLPTGQVSWYIHDSDLPIFGFLPKYLNKWDGHTTDDKYGRVLLMLAFQGGAKAGQ